MSKYINADELIKFCTSMLVKAIGDEIIQTHNNAFRHMREHIKSLPAADVVEVVRCEDCKYYSTDNMGYCNKPNSGLMFADENDFCSYAERRENNDKG